MHSASCFTTEGTEDTEVEIEEEVEVLWARDSIERVVGFGM